jgi:Acetyltransferase (GNAT) domain
MPGSYRVFESIEDVDLAAWESVRAAGGSSIFMDPRFIAAAESSMKNNYRFWYVIIYDDDNHPVACAGLCAMTIDLADWATPRLASLIRRVPKALLSFLKVKALFCGLPGSPGEKNLALRSTDASSQVLRLLDEVICDLAARTGMDLIVYKEFGNDDLAWMDALLDLGYRRVPIDPMQFFKPAFADFAQYCAALSSRYRRHITLSMRKLKSAGVEPSILTDPEEILRAYTPEVHDLHSQMVAKAEINIEVLPIEFFHQLTSRLKGNVELVTLSKDSRILAIAWCLQDASSYYLLYGGLDYQLNHQMDLYFNLMYATLDRALQKRVSKIYVGQTADAFKARIGCYAEPLYAFAKGRGVVMSPLVRYGGNLAHRPVSTPRDIFKKMGDE